MSEARPYHRAQPRDWWAHKPYLAYTMRELTGIAVALYAAILFAGLICLWRGPASFEAFREFLASPLSLVIHLVLLAGMIWHVVTWFQIMPKTMPKLILNGRHVPQKQLTAIGLILAFACSAALVAAVVVVGALS